MHSVRARRQQSRVCRSIEEDFVQTGVLAEVTFEGGFPGHKTEAEPILDQRKSARWQT
jgi:hypothetical protein